MKLILIAASLPAQFGPRTPLTPAETLLEPAVLKFIADESTSPIGLHTIAGAVDTIDGSEAASGNIPLTCALDNCQVASQGRSQTQFADHFEADRAACTDNPRHRSTAERSYFRDSCSNSRRAENGPGRSCSARRCCTAGSSTWRKALPVSGPAWASPARRSFRRRSAFAARGGDDRRVPTRIGTGATAKPELPTAFLKFENVHTVVAELGNFVDGKRSISDIRDAVSAEFNPIALPVVVEYFERLAKLGEITITQPQARE